MPEPIDRQELIRAASEARGRAYAPYSHFPVGAAVLGISGRIYVGCNVENLSFGLTACAERVAAFNAVSEGERQFRAIAVVSSNGSTPCGACRQVLSEFGPDMEVIVASEGAADHQVYALRDLLPHAFDAIQ